jgi:hypothetical protein
MGEVIQTVTIPVLDDGIITSNLTVNLALNPSPPAAFGGQPLATLTIVNDDSEINFASATYTVSKNAVNGAATINILRLGGVYGTSTVDFSTTTNGTAAPITDYYPTNILVVFNPGVSNVAVTVPIINNGLAEGNQTVGLQLTNATGSLLYNPSNAVLTIIDTLHSPGQLTFSATNYVVTEGGGVGYTNAYITVLRVNGSLGTVSASYSTADGTALAGVKYIPTNGVVNYGDGETGPKTFAVQVINTLTGEGTEYLNLLLTNATGGATLLAPTNATLTIINTNAGVAFATAIQTNRETDGSAVINVLRINNTNGTTTVNYATADGTALSNVNYTVTAGALTFAPGQVSKTLFIPLLHDTNLTGNLSFTIGLSNPGSGTSLAPPSVETIVVEDAEAGLSFTNPTMSVFKNAGSAVITVVCSNPGVEPVVVNSNTVPLSVNYATSDGTATAGRNYTGVSGTLVFTNGIATNTFTVPIINDGNVSGDRTFNVTLSSPTAPGRLVAPSTQTVTIIDSNSGLEFSSPTYTVLKTGVAASINVFRTGFTDSVVSVGYIATNGTAISGLDYVATSGTLVFTNGVTNQAFTVQIVDISTVQPDKTVLLQLLSPANAILLAPNAATLTIHDNAGSYVIPAGSTLVSESGAGAPNGVIDSNETVTILFALRDAGGTNVTDLKATLIATNGITSPSPQTQDYGPLAYLGHSTFRPFTFTAQGTNGQQIAATFLLTNNIAGNAVGIGTALFTYTLGNWTASFSNTALIEIPDNIYASGAGPANPYPSVINVSGVPGTVVKTTVTWTNISHTSPSDIAALLVSPSQFNALLMANAGAYNGITHVTLIFDDAAASSLPKDLNTTITNGVYKPSGYLPLQLPFQ